MVKNEKGERSSCRTRRSRASCTRRTATSASKAFHQYYAQFKRHENSLAAALLGSVQNDVYYAKARGYPSAREASLFPDNVPVARLRQPDRRGARQAAGASTATSTCGGGR